MPLPAPVDPRLKAQVLAELATGAPLKAIARKHGLSTTAIRRWRDEAGLSRVFTQEQQADVGAALDRYLCAVIEGLKLQFEHTLKSNWFADHGIDDYLKLLRAHQDGIARVVEAQTGAAEDEQPTPIRRAV